MSQENVEVVRRIWHMYAEALRQGDLDAATDVYDEGLVAVDSTYTPVRDMPGTRTYVGREEFIEFVRTWSGEWDDWQVELERAIDAGEDRVVAVVHQSATGKGSGAAVDVRFGAVYTLRGGTVVDRRDYWVDEALELAGLSG